MAVGVSESTHFPTFYPPPPPPPISTVTIPPPGSIASGLNHNQSHPSHHPSHHRVHIQEHPHHRWRFFSVPTRSYWTKYCLLCTICGSAATILAGIFLVVAALFRYYTTSIHYFETIPTYIPAVLLCICGISTIAFSWKRYRNIILLKITACWSLVNAALSSVITITTSLIHMNRLQTIRECIYNGKVNPPSCTCVAHTISIDSIGNGFDPVHYVFENTPDCGVIHGTLYSCLRAVFAISVVAVLLSIFLCMLLYQLIGHERKKAYWSRIRRINSDWSGDFIACLARPMGRERSSMLPLSLSPTGMGLPGSGGLIPPPGMFTWGPPPPYEHVREENRQRQSEISHSVLSMMHSSNSLGTIPTFVAVPPPPASIPPAPPTVDTCGAEGHNNKPPTTLELGTGLSFPLINTAHPFSPTITSVDPEFHRSNHNRPLQIPPSNQRGNYQINQVTSSNHPSESANTIVGSNCSVGAGVEEQDKLGYQVHLSPEPTPLFGRRVGESPSMGKRIKNAKIKFSSKHNSLPNSPILMNVRKLVSFRIGDKVSKTFSNSTTRMYGVLDSPNTDETDRDYLDDMEVVQNKVHESVQNSISMHDDSLTVVLHGDSLPLNLMTTKNDTD